MNTKTLRSLFNVFSQMIETNPADEAEFNLYYLYHYVDLQRPEGCVDWCTLPAELRDGSLGLAIEYTYIDDEGDDYTTLLVLRPDYETGRMVREMPLKPRRRAN